MMAAWASPAMKVRSRAEQIAALAGLPARRAWWEPVGVEFSNFRDSFAALPPGRLSLDDARVPQFCIYEDRRLIAYYAPFDYLNTRARVTLVGVTPGPTQMLESYAIVRDALRAGRRDEDALRSVKAHASFKGMRRDLARWLNELGLAPVLGLQSCAELFEDSHRGLLHTTSAVRHPVFVRKRDRSLANYSGSSPGLTAHPWLRGMIQATLAGELAALGLSIVIPLGQANRAVTHLQDLEAIDPARCLLGLPHPSPASPFRERYFQAVKTRLIRQVQRLDPPVAPPGTPHPVLLDTHERSGPPLTPDPAHDGNTRIVIQLTQGNLSHDHVYLRAHLGFFPADAMGAPNARDGTGTLLTLHFEGLPGTVRTDIAADKRIFRCRRPWGNFFKRHDLQPGDRVAIERLSAYEYRVLRTT